MFMSMPIIYRFDYICITVYLPMMVKLIGSPTLIKYKLLKIKLPFIDRGSRGRDRIVVGITTARTVSVNDQ
jgi:hypothetical protein